MPGLRPRALRRLLVGLLGALTLAAIAASTAAAAPPSGTVGAVTEVTETSALATGTVSANGEDTGYHFEYATAEAGPWFRGEESFSGATVPAATPTAAVSERLRGSYAYFGDPNFDFFIALTPATHYFVRLVAENTAGTFVSTAPYAQFTTLAPPPGGTGNPCLGDLCQPLPPEPEDPTPGTLHAKPSGNGPAPKKHGKQCRKGQVKQRGRCVRPKKHVKGGGR